MFSIFYQLSFSKYNPASLVKEVIKEKIKSGIVCKCVHWIKYRTVKDTNHQSIKKNYTNKP